MTSYRLRVNVIIWVFILTLALPVTAFADEPADRTRPQTPHSDRSTAEIVPRGEDGASTDATIQDVYLGNYGCFGQTDQPHRSTHVPGTVNVVSRSYCASAMPWLWVAVDLYKVSWWGFSKSFVGTGLNDVFGGSNVRTNAAGTCKSGDYEAYGYHQVQFPTGIYGSAGTSNSAHVNC